MSPAELPRAKPTLGMFIKIGDVIQPYVGLRLTVSRLDWADESFPSGTRKATAPSGTYMHIHEGETYQVIQP